MKKNAIALAVAGIAVALVCIVAVLGLKLNSKPSLETEPNVVESVYSAGTTFPVFSETRFSIPETTELILPSTTVTSTTQPETTTKAPSTAAPTETLTFTEKLSQVATTVVNTVFKEVFSLPKAPKYVPPDVNLDFANINLASYKYDPDGNFYYTDDKECWQKNFGFNEVYDSFAPLTMMYYDTVRTTFEYGGKEWLIQLWKGQYGMYFVGGEVGVYTRKPGSSGSHFVCADKSDWLYMETAFMWDEYETGEYRAVFNRDYDKYWWATGFVVGFPNGSLRKTLSEFRLVAHITFKDAQMADAFCAAFEKNGFKRVTKLDNNAPDTFVQVGSDVAFVWQNINHK